MDRDEVTADYDAVYARDRERSRPASRLVLQMIDALPTGEIVELGAGLGHDSLFLASRGYTVTARDLSRVAVDTINQQAELRGLSNLRAEVADACAPLERDVDGVLSLFLAHYLSRAEAVQLLAATRERTRPGGVHAHAFMAAGSGPFQSGPDPFLPTREHLLELYAGWQVLLLADWRLTPRETEVRGEWYGLSIVARRPHPSSR